MPEALHGDWSVSSGYEQGRILAARDEVTAVFCANDQMALGLYRALYEAGRTVPRDVSVVGVRQHEDTRGYAPPLTSVHHEFSDVGRLCIQSALALARGEPVDPLAVVTTTLVVRDSTTSAT